MILAWYAFVALAGVCIMYTLAHVVGGWLFEREAEPSWKSDDYSDSVPRPAMDVSYSVSAIRQEWDGIVANPSFGEAAQAPDRVAEMEAVAAAAWGRWSHECEW